jgi:hypothetical protein
VPSFVKVVQPPRQLARSACVQNPPRQPPAWCVQNRVPPTGQFGCVQKWVHQLASSGVSKILPGRGRARPLAGPKANWPVCWTKQHLTPRRILRTGERPGPPEPTSARPATAQVPRADWRVPPTARRGPRGARPSTAPLQAPGAAGALDGEVLTNKSSQGRADAQRLVATRLLDRVHDPLGHFSRLQRIYPRAR